METLDLLVKFRMVEEDYGLNVCDVTLSAVWVAGTLRQLPQKSHWKSQASCGYVNSLDPSGIFFVNFSGHRLLI